MDIKELQNIIAEYGKVKSKNVIVIKMEEQKTEQ